MKWKTVAIVGIVLFLAGFLLGFIPEYQKASKLTTQLETARLESKLREIRALASLSYIDATKLNYGQQRKIRNGCSALPGKWQMTRRTMACGAASMVY
jgi:hypothetical protein